MNAALALRRDGKALAQRIAWQDWERVAASLDACGHAVLPGLLDEADAIAMAERWPVGMLFVRNHRGISHHPAESVAVNDVAPALQAYLQAVCLIAERS